MSDNLRLRIIGLLQENPTWDGSLLRRPWAEHVADAIIRDLHLTEDGGVIVGCVHE